MQGMLPIPLTLNSHWVLKAACAVLGSVGWEDVVCWAQGWQHLPLALLDWSQFKLECLSPVDCTLRLIRTLSSHQVHKGGLQTTPSHWMGSLTRATRAGSPVSQPCPGLHPQQHGSREGGFVPLCSAQEGPHLQFCLEFWGSQHQKVVELLE